LTIPRHSYELSVIPLAGFHVFMGKIFKNVLFTSVAEPHHFYAATAPGKNFDAAPAAPAPTLLYRKANFLK
jgi:hypothetical protein